MTLKLSISEGPKNKTTENLPMYPEGLEIGEEERKLVTKRI